jgi:chromosome partitioning protein
MRCVAFANQKGGVGKTSAAVNLAATIGASGRRVLLIDLDPQGSATRWVGQDPTPLLYRAFLGARLMLDAVQPIAWPGVDLIAASSQLQAADAQLAGEPGAEAILRGLLQTLPARRWHACFMDCPPGLGIVTLNALLATSELLVPIETSTMALEGTAALMERLEKIAERFQVTPPPARFLVCRTRPRTRLTQDVIHSTRKRFGRAVFRATISDSVRMQEAPSHHVPILKYAPKHKVTAEFLALAREWGQKPGSGMRS